MAHPSPKAAPAKALNKLSSTKPASGFWLADQISVSSLVRSSQILLKLWY